MSAEPTAVESLGPLGSIDRSDQIVALCLSLLAILIFGRTLATEVLFGDSGEFQVLSRTGGLAHATGYPLYLVFGKLFSLVPIGTVAGRVNFVSSFFGAAAVGLVYLVGRSLAVRRVFAAIAASVLLIAPIFWWQSVVAEVYTISAAFLSAVLLCALIWRRTRNSALLLWGGLLGALCLGLHHSVVLAMPAVLLYLVICRASKSEWKAAGVGILSGAAVSFALYMVMASIDSPATSTNYSRPSAVSYGLNSAEDFDSPFTRAKFVFLAEQFTADGIFQAKYVPANLKRLQAQLSSDFGWLIPSLGLLGVVAMFVRRGRRREGVMLLTAYCILLVFPLMHFAFDLEVEFIQSHVVMCVLAAVGLQALQDSILSRQRATKTHFLIAGAVASIGVLANSSRLVGEIPPALAAGKPTFLEGVFRQFPYNIDYPAEAHDAARQMIGLVPDNSMLLVEWTYVYDLHWVAQFEMNKKGIEVVEPFPSFPIKEDVALSMIEFYARNALKRPMFADSVRDGMKPYFDHVPALTDPNNGTVYLYQLILKRQKQ